MVTQWHNWAGWRGWRLSRVTFVTLVTLTTDVINYDTNNTTTSHQILQIWHGHSAREWGGIDHGMTHFMYISCRCTYSNAYRRVASHACMVLSMNSISSFWITKFAWDIFHIVECRYQWVNWQLHVKHSICIQTASERRWSVNEKIKSDQWSMSILSLESSV